MYTILIYSQWVCRVYNASHPTSCSFVLWLWLFCNVAFLSFLLPQSVSPTHCHMPMLFAVSVILANDCHMFALLLTTGNTWNITESEYHIPAISSDIVMHVVAVLICISYCFLLPPTLVGESHSFLHAPMMCAVSMILYIACDWCLLYSCFNLLEHMGHNRRWVTHPHNF